MAKKPRTRIGLNGIPTYLPQWPSFGTEEQKAVYQVLGSGRVNYWTGNEGREFEREFAEYVGSRYALTVANGTVALELALHALGIGAGDEVITTPRTFVASASAAVARGAVPVFADVDADSGNITAETIRAVITDRTRAIIVVHLAGWPADMDPIMELAQEHDLKVIEDCAQAHGATYRGRMVGSIGHAGAFSFCQDKIMTTGGEGGMVTLNDEAVWKRAWAYRDHGKDWDAVHAEDHPPGYRFLTHSFGTNMRLSEMQSAVGRVQLRKLPEWLRQRSNNARLLTAELSGIPGLRIPLPAGDSTHAWYKLYAYLDLAALASGWDRQRILQEAGDAGVPLFTGTGGEIYLERAFETLGHQPVQKVARELGDSSLMFLVHPTLQGEHILMMAQRLRPILERALSVTAGGPQPELAEHADERHHKDRAVAPRGQPDVADWERIAGTD